VEIYLSSKHKEYIYGSRNVIFLLTALINSYFRFSRLTDSCLFCKLMSFHSFSCAMVIGGSPGGKCGQGVLLTAHPLLLLWFKKERGYTSFPPMHQNWHITDNFHLNFYAIYIINIPTYNTRSYYERLTEIQAGLLCIYHRDIYTR
jgi:hypothetical protein